jgi:hypothetical protein
LHAIACKKQEGSGRFDVAMTAHENRRFLGGIAADHREYYSMLGRVNAETSDCTRAEDRLRIHEGIQSSVGFAMLNRMVFGVMESWMEDQLRRQISRHTALGHELRAMEWSATLAIVLHEQGRLDEAARIRETVLSVEERLLGTHHPTVGTDLAVLGACVHSPFKLTRFSSSDG